jgi:hypothetical protein
MTQDLYKETRAVPRILCYVLFCCAVPRMHDVHIADNLSKTLQVITVVTGFGYDDFLTCCIWELKVLNNLVYFKLHAYAAKKLILYVNGDYNMEYTIDCLS